MRTRLGDPTPYDEDEPSPQQLGDMRSFKKLECLKVNQSALLASPEQVELGENELGEPTSTAPNVSSVVRFADILPKSLMKLSILCCDGRINEYVQGLSCETAKAFPHLSSINVWYAYSEGGQTEVGPGSAASNGRPRVVWGYEQSIPKALCTLQELEEIREDIRKSLGYGQSS